VRFLIRTLRLVDDTRIRELICVSARCLLSICEDNDPVCDTIATEEGGACVILGLYGIGI